MPKTFFTGSYSVDDVQFLLKPMSIQNTPIHEKEALIQSGQRHYSELLSHETPPSDAYLQLFHAALHSNQQRMAQHLVRLAEQIVATRPQGITLVSLARAGTPIGVLLKHILKRYHSIDAAHYSVSILRDIGLDVCALRYLLQHHAPESLVFVDGWTGKGVIARQLTDSLRLFSITDGVVIPPELYVLADLSGSAAVSACSEDYLIPSCILNATVSGLVSRSFYNQDQFEIGDFHGCMYYQDYAPYDLSRYFIDTLLIAVDNVVKSSGDMFTSMQKEDRLALQAASARFVHAMQQRYGVSHSHYIKPGIGEATRVLLRRKARLLLLREPSHAATQHLRWLAESKSIPIELCRDLPYQAAALITEVS